MKRLFFCLVLINLFELKASAQTQAASSNTSTQTPSTTKVTPAGNNNNGIQNSVNSIVTNDELNKRINDTNSKLKSLSGTIDSFKKNDFAIAYVPGAPVKEIGVVGTLLWSMPILLFLLFFFFVLNRVNMRDALREALTDKDATPVGITQVPLNDNAGNPIKDTTTGQQATMPINVYPKSSSRLIMFFSSVVAIIIALCVFSTCIYSYLKTGVVPDFSKVVSLMLSLGIGVIPYLISKFTSSSDTSSVTVPSTKLTVNSPKSTTNFESNTGEKGSQVETPETVSETISMVRIPK